MSSPSPPSAAATPGPRRTVSPGGGSRNYFAISTRTNEVFYFGEDKEYKLYAPGVGLIKDGSLELVSHASIVR